MPEKRPSDRKSVYLRVRITKGTRAALNKAKLSGESLSDAARRLLGFALTLTAEEGSTAQEGK